MPVFKYLPLTSVSAERQAQAEASMSICWRDLESSAIPSNQSPVGGGPYFYTWLKEFTKGIRQNSLFSISIFSISTINGTILIYSISRKMELVKQKSKTKRWSNLSNTGTVLRTKTITDDIFFLGGGGVCVFVCTIQKLVKNNLKSRELFF